MKFDDWDRENKDSYTESSPSESEDEETKPRKKSSITSYPIFNPNVAAEKVKLVSELKFANKAQLRSAFGNYRIMNGFDINITKSDMIRFLARCIESGCTWRNQASPCSNMAPWQIKSVSEGHGWVQR